MQSLGLSASYPLKAVFLTHGHGDHDGGAQWLLTNLGARSYLGSADAGGKSYAPTTINSADLSFREMSIGGKTFWVLPTPGHTPGSTSAVLEVSDWGTTRRVLINGGQSMTNSIPQVAQYLDSIERTYSMAKALRVDGVMTPHIYWDGEGAKLNEIRRHGPDQPEPAHLRTRKRAAPACRRARVLRGLAHAARCDEGSLGVAGELDQVDVWKSHGQPGFGAGDKRLGPARVPEGSLHRR